MSSRTCRTLQQPLAPLGSRGDGNVASSLCASFSPAQRLQPRRWCTLLSVFHRSCKSWRRREQEVCGPDTDEAMSPPSLKGKGADEAQSESSWTALAKEEERGW